MSGIDDWVRHCDTEGRELCALVPPHLQLETPGSELRFIINNHDGPVMEAMWAPDDENICYSFSSKMVAVSLELGQVVIDTRPRSVPRGDCFKKALFMNLSEFQNYNKEDFGIQDKELVLASLREHPWLYVFTAEGDLLKCIKCEEVLKEELEALDIEPEQLRISDMTLVDADDSLLVLYDNMLPHLIYLKRDFSLRLQPMPDTGNVVTVARCSFEDGNCVVPVVYDDKGEVYVYRKDTKAVLQRLGSPISAHYEMKDTELDSDIVLCGLGSGKIVLIKAMTDYVTGGEEFDQKNANGRPRYGVGNFVHLKRSNANTTKSIDMLAAVCTMSHLLLLVPNMGYEEDSSDGLNDEGNSDNSSDKSDVFTKKMQRKAKKEPKRKQMKLALRVKKWYHMAEIMPSFNLLIAANGGQLDLFQVGN